MLVFYRGSHSTNKILSLEEFDPIDTLTNEETDVHITFSARTMLLCCFLGQLNFEDTSIVSPTYWGNIQQGSGAAMAHRGFIIPSFQEEKASAVRQKPSVSLTFQVPPAFHIVSSM